MAAPTEQERPPRRRVPPRDEARYNFVIDVFLFVVCTAVIVASMLLTPGDEGVSIMGFTIPSTCMFRNLTGMRCLGCGLTRSFTYMGHGDIVSAFHHHVIGPIFFVFVAAQSPYRLVRTLRHLRNR